MYKAIGVIAICLFLRQIGKVWGSFGQYRRYWSECTKLKRILAKSGSDKKANEFDREIFYRVAYMAIFEHHLTAIMHTRCSSKELPGYIHIPSQGYGVISDLWLPPQTWDWLKSKEINKLPDPSEELNPEDLIRVNDFFKPGSSAILQIVYGVVLAIIWLIVGIFCFTR